MYLNGEFGQNPNDVNAYVASTFYAVDRYASYKKNWKEFYDFDGIIIADRYTTSNAVHQCSKLDVSEWDDYIQWLFDLEYNKMQIPAPTKVIYLDMTPDVSQKLLNNRYDNDQDKKDIHEKDIKHLENSRKSALYCLEKLNWDKIRCDDGQNAYSIQEISQEILKLVQQVI